MKLERRVGSEVDALLDELAEMYDGSSADTFWTAKKRAHYPLLAECLQYLFVLPASSVAAEGSFSTGHQVVDLNAGGGSMLDSTIRTRTKLKFDRFRFGDVQQAVLTHFNERLAVVDADSDAEEEEQAAAEGGPPPQEDDDDDEEEEDEDGDARMP